MSVADAWQLECSWRTKETHKTSPWHHTLCITFFLFLVIIVVSCCMCRPESKKAEPCFEKSILWWFYGSSLRQCRKLGWAFSKMKYNPSHSKDSTLAGFETQLPRVPHLVEIRGYDTGARWSTLQGEGEEMAGDAKLRCWTAGGGEAAAGEEKARWRILLSRVIIPVLKVFFDFTNTLHKGTRRPLMCCCRPSENREMGPTETENIPAFQLFHFVPEFFFSQINDTEDEGINSHPFLSW